MKMWKEHCLYLILAVFMCKTIAVDIGPTITVARCRAHCIKETLKNNNRVENNACQRKNSCRNCWEMCPLLVFSYSAWSGKCVNKKVCNRGCRKACQFHKNIPDVVQSPVKWKFKKPFVYSYDLTSKLVIGWHQPEADVKLREKPVFVYILFVRDSHQKDIQWKKITQTASTNVQLSQNDLPKIPEFLILAVIKNGTVADIRFNSTVSPINWEIKPPEENQPFKEHITSDSPLNMTVTSTVNETNSDGSVDAIVEWDHPPHSSQSTITYTVNWFLERCGIYVDSPNCEIPDQHWASTAIVDVDEKPSYRIKGIIYNAKYLIRVEIGDGKTWYGEAIFFSLDCSNVDELTFKECPLYKNSKEATDNSGDTKTREKSKESTDSSVDTWTRETKKDIQHGNRNREDVPFLHWKLNVSSMSYDDTTEMVIVRVNWSAPFNRSAVEMYTLICKSVDYTKDIRAGKQNLTNTTVQLKFKPNRLYEMQVVAYYKDITGSLMEYESDWLELNTSGIDEMPSFPRMQNLVENRVPSFKQLDGIIVGITIVLSVVMLGLIILFIYKKRQSFKDIIITKTAVAKSNSYKSNVGCKMDYSNQLLVMSDEWELDPRAVKFSSPIGQGAFGKVVTGYFEDRRVAIKLVRDSAPLSYKEDLLAEINLMKRIGTHPNIVSMIGACTLSEPIALVMEYIPYGNLQNFLKKCRMEGELQKRIGHPVEITYSVMDHDGGIDNGVITPADMLSFARQVAMAMEYLAEKKYVHRDLAARNILLDYNKVVKVCDFGLSRDIYNDNQYHKVTSGKLPLKWMAIESFRDRIFTTPSDVWSFGILLWEIVTMGGSPYPSIAIADLYTFLSNGYRMEKPSNCSEELYVIMSQCWLENPADRLTFTEIRLQLEQLLSRDRNYLELDNIDIPLSKSESSSNSRSDRDSASLLTTTQPCTSMPQPSKSTSQPFKSMSPGKSTQPGKSSQPKRVVIPQDPTISICVEKSTEWLIRGRDDETASS